MHEDSVYFKILANIADFSCVISWAQNDPIPANSHIILKYSIRRGLTNKSNYGGVKVKSLSYLCGLINHAVKHTKSEKQTDIQAGR